MKKYFLFFLFVISSIFCFAESYKINEVSYDISGKTREYALVQKVPVDTDTVFASFEDFEKYLTSLKQELNNQRVFQSSDITYTLSESSEVDLILVDLLITTQDTINIIGIPYPSYNSNTGITLKIKVKDYNFCGSMEPMDFDLNYKAKGTDALDDVTHVIGLNFGFEVPFEIVNLSSSWSSDFNFEYTFGESGLDMSICEGIGISVPIGDITSAKIAFNQYYIQDSSYVDYGDDKYLKEDVSVSFPFTIAKIPDWSKISWTPKIGLDYSWDFDAFNGDPYGGIDYNGLRGPQLTLSHALSGSHVNWNGNFRDGFSCSLSQTFGYNFYNDKESMNLVFTSQYYKKLCSFIGLASRLYVYKDFYGANKKFGSMIRGIRDGVFKSNQFVLLNLDFPFRLFQTDWRKIIGWDKLHYIDFEFQLSPFVDMVFAENSYTKTKFNPKDAWYGAGMEMIVYPTQFRSIQGRISFGVDAVQFLKKTGNRVGALNGMADKLFNTKWRKEADSHWYELTIGIGLFY